MLHTLPSSQALLSGRLFHRGATVRYKDWSCSVCYVCALIFGNLTSGQTQLLFFCNLIYFLKAMDDRPCKTIIKLPIHVCLFVLGPCTTSQRPTFNQCPDGAVLARERERNPDHALFLLLFIQWIDAAQIPSQVHLLKPCFVLVQIPQGIYQKVIRVPEARPLLF